MDGAAKIRGLLLVTPGPVREARGGVQHDSARGHHHGLLERILRASPPAGLLRGAAVPYGAGHDDAYDPPGAHMGPKGYLYPRFVFERRGLGQGQDERSRGLFRVGGQKLRGQNGGGKFREVDGGFACQDVCVMGENAAGFTEIVVLLAYTQTAN